MRAVFLCLLSLVAGMSAVTLFGAEPGQDPSDAMTIMSFNIRYGSAQDGENHWDKRKEFVAETIREVSPELLGMQECLGFQRDFLAKHLPQYEVFAAGRDDGKEGGEMCAIFFRRDRFEKLDAGHFWLSETPDVPGSKSWDTSLTRMASWVKLKDKSSDNKRPILYVNTHFDHRGQEARFESAKLIRRWASKFTDCDVVVTGDFNSGEGSKPYQAMFGEEKDDVLVVDTYRTIKPERGAAEGTFSGFKAESTQGERIDWIGVSEGFDVIDAAILHASRDGRTPSDHFPVTAKVSR